MSKRVAIIGAGYGGLALANLLAKRGYMVEIYEQHKKPGGRTGSIKKDGFTFDTGPSWYLMPEVFEQYYKLFNLSAEKQLDIRRLTPGYKVFFESSEPIIIEGNLAKDKRTFDRIEPNSGKSLEKYINKSRVIYDLSLKHFLYTNFESTKQFFHKDITKRLPSLARFGIKTVDQHVSAHFKDQRLKQILEYHAVFLGTSPFQAPALYSLMSVLDFESGVFYPKKGMYSLVQSLYEIGTSLGVQYHFNSTVKSIITDNGIATGLKLQTGQVQKADVIVSNADLHFTETKLVPTKFRSFNENYWHKRQSGPSALLISLGIKGVIPQLLHHNLFFVDQWKQNFEAIYGSNTIPENASLYVCNPTKTDSSVAPKNHENIFILVPLPAGIAIGAKQQQSLVDRFIKQLEVMAKIPDLQERIVTSHVFGPEDFKTNYNSWQSGALGGQSHRLFQSALFRTPNKSKKLNNLFYVGAGTVPGIGLPMCLMSAELVYKRIEGIKTNGPLKEVVHAGV